jgi:hypothetical protein
MVPIYAICSYTSLVLWVSELEQYTYIPNAFRECYEAYTVYNFLRYMTTFLETYYGESAAAVLAKVCCAARLTRRDSRRIQSHPNIEAVGQFFPFRVVLPQSCARDTTFRVFKARLCCAPRRRR